MAASDTGHERLVIYWTLHNDTGGTLACELSRTGQGLVVRSLDGARNVVLSERVAAVAAGAKVASAWKARLLEKGDYFERPRLADSREARTQDAS
jgi:hypothetical protein